MTSIFWDSQGVTMVDYLEEGRTISGAHYAEKIGRLRQEIVKQNSEKLTWGDLLLQDNASAQISHGCCD